MKIVILFVVLLFSQSAQSDNDVSGQWRGLLKLTPQSAIVLGIGIRKTDSNVTVVVNSPNQGMPDKPVDEFTFENNQLSFKVEDLVASFTGTFEDNTLTGTFTQRKAFDITLHRLSEKQQAKLIDERQWFGDLQVSKNAELPLVLNIAVVSHGYHVTLDSPQQQSFGIPVDEFSLTDEHLTFASSMINASYKGNWQDDSWRGTFVQGMAMPLTFKKKPPPLASPDIADLRPWMKEYFNRHGVAIGLIKNNNIRYLVHGYADIANNIKVSSETRFEIGSISKPLTAFLFASEAASGTLRLNTPVSSLLPNVANALKQITLAELLTHQSGLPRLPPNLAHIGILNPYADYDKEQLLRAVNSVTPAQRSFQYSNFGYAILALAAESRYADNYTMLMRKSVFPVFNMQNADVASADKTFSKLANGHLINGDKTINWQFDSMAGAGGVIASICDMTQMIARILTGYETSPALNIWLTPLSDGEHSMAMGWMISDDGSYFHGGQTLGFSAYVGFNLDTQAGVAILTNIAKDVSVPGFQILRQLNKQQD